MSDFSATIQNLLYASEHDLLTDSLGQAVRRSIDFGVADEFEHSVLTQRVQRHKLSEAFSPSPPFKTPKLLAGNFVQGMNLSGNELRYSHLIRQEPSIVIAGTGSGKTTLFRFEALQWAMLTEGLWLFDLRKNDFAGMRPYFKRLGVDLQVVSARRMKVNICQIPDHVDPVAFASALTQSLAGILELPPVAERLLFQSLLSLYQKNGVLNGSTDYPTLFDVLESVRSNRKAHSSAREAVVVRLETLLMSIGDVLCYRQGWTHRNFASRKIAFSFYEIGQVEQDILLNWLILSEFLCRIASGKSNKPIELKIIVDEASRLVRNSTSSIGSSVSVARGSGIGCTFSNQDAELARTIISNSPNKFLGRCFNASDYSVMGSSMGLTTEQVRYLQHNLQPGMFCGQLGQGSHRQPFLFRVPLIKIKSGNVSHHCPELDALPVQKAAEFENWRPDWLANDPVQLTPSESKPAPVEPLPGRSGTEMLIHNQVSESTRSPRLSADEQRFLAAVVAEPCKPVSFYPPVVRFSKRKALAIRKSLIQRGYLQEQKTQTSGRGRPSILLAATQQGAEILDQWRSQ